MTLLILLPGRTALLSGALLLNYFCTKAAVAYWYDQPRQFAPMSLNEPQLMSPNEPQ